MFNILETNMLEKASCSSLDISLCFVNPMSCIAVLPFPNICILDWFPLGSSPYCPLFSFLQKPRASSCLLLLGLGFVRLGLVRRRWNCPLCMWRLVKWASRGTSIMLNPGSDMTILELYPNLVTTNNHCKYLWIFLFVLTGLTLKREWYL